MGYNPEDLEYLHLAARKRLGEPDPRRVDVVGTPVADVRAALRHGIGQVRPRLRRARAFGAGSSRRPTQRATIQTADGTGRGSTARTATSISPITWEPAPRARSGRTPSLLADEPLTPELWLGVGRAGDVWRCGRRAAGRALTGRRAPAGRGAQSRCTYRPDAPACSSRWREGASGFGFSLLLCGQPGCLPLGLHCLLPTRQRRRRRWQRRG